MGMSTDGYADWDTRWNSHYANAAERLFGKVNGDLLTAEEDAACIADADARMADEDD